MHHIFRPYDQPGTCARTQLTTACHSTGEVMSFTLEGGQVVGMSHPSSSFCFSRPLRNWYADLVDT